MQVGLYQHVRVAHRKLAFVSYQLIAVARHILGIDSSRKK